MTFVGKDRNGKKVYVGDYLRPLHEKGNAQDPWYVEGVEISSDDNLATAPTVHLTRQVLIDFTHLSCPNDLFSYIENYDYQELNKPVCEYELDTLMSPSRRR